MDHNQILSIMYDAYKSLTVSHIEILLSNGPILKVRVIAEAYAKLTIPQRTSQLTLLLRNYSESVSLNYAISFEPLTPSEHSEWSNNSANTNESGGESSGVAAKNIDL